MVGNTTTVCDVAIIGLGPVGTTLANLLGQMGISTVALDQASEISPLPRAVSFDDEVMRIFQTMGLSEAINEISEVGAGAKFIDSEGKILVNWERPMKRTPNGWCVNYRFNQPELEQALRNGASRFSSVTLKLGCEVTDLQESEEGVALTYLESGTQQVLQAGYVVGCDGGRSFTREKVGATFEDLGFHEEWLIVDLLLPEKESDPDRFTYHYCGASRMGSKVFVGSKRKRWELRLKETDNRETIQTPETVWKILEPWIKPSEAKIERTALYTFHSTIADHWKKGRVFLAGDAAHQTPPFMAQGMCAGIRDAANLAWKLERVIRHGATKRLLDTYQSERSPHVREYINLTMEFGKLINATALSVTNGNPTNLSDGKQTVSQLRPKLGPGISASDSSHCGRLLPQFALSDGRLLDDSADFTTTLVLTDEAGKKIDKSLRSEFLTSGIGVFDNPGQELATWLSEAGAIAVLVSPDRYVLGTASSIKDITQLQPSMWTVA